MDATTAVISEQNQQEAKPKFTKRLPYIERFKLYNLFRSIGGISIIVSSQRNNDSTYQAILANMSKANRKSSGG